MTSSSKKAMTWGTLAAAVLGALAVAAIDSGGPDTRRGAAGASEARRATGSTALGRPAPAPGTAAGRDGLDRGGVLQR